VARTQIALTTLTRNGITDIPAGTSIDQANGMYIDLTTTAIPDGPGSENLMLEVRTTSGSDQVVTIKAGIGGGIAPGAAMRAAIGDMTLTAHAASGGGIIGGLESARFMQSNNQIYINFDSGTTGWITAYCSAGHQ
jgi:hypothetical protein